MLQKSSPKIAKSKTLVIIVALLLFVVTTAESCEADSQTPKSKTNETVPRTTSSRIKGTLTTAPEQSSTTTSSTTPLGPLYPVTKVVDGDTAKVNIDGVIETLRLIGIDTPETKDPRKPVQCFGQEASNRAKQLLENSNVHLEADPTQGERDKYGRLLRYIFLADGTNFNEKMIFDGYAHEYTYNLPYKYQAQFKEAQTQADQNNRGLWAASTCAGNT